MTENSNQNKSLIINTAIFYLSFFANVFLILAKYPEKYQLIGRAFLSGYLALLGYKVAIETYNITSKKGLKLILYFRILMAIGFISEILIFFN